MSNYYEFRGGCRIDPYANWIMQITHQGFVPTTILDEEKINRYNQYIIELEEMRLDSFITLRTERPIVNKIFTAASETISLHKDAERAKRMHAQYNKSYNNG